MLEDNHRKKKLTYKPDHLSARLKERKHLFPSGHLLPDMWREISAAIKDPQKGIILEDNRDGKNSTHVCVFVTEAGKIAALPIAVNQDTIHVFTIKDVKNDENNPNWFIQNYNLVAEKRNMGKLPYIVKV